MAGLHTEDRTSKNVSYGELAMEKTLRRFGRLRLRYKAVCKGDTKFTEIESRLKWGLQVKDQRRKQKRKKRKPSILFLHRKTML